MPRTPRRKSFIPRFVEALQKQDHVEYLLDVLLFGETEEKAALITEYGKDVIQLEQRMAELAAAAAARTKKHHERHAALGKPCWMLNYTGEPHWPTKIANKIDFQKRMFQFFNH